MSKTAEERMGELEAQLKRRDQEVEQLRSNYNQVYQHMQEAEKTAMYYKGQTESGPSEEGSYETPSAHGVAGAAVDYSSVDVERPEEVVNVLEDVIRSRLEPRLQQIERYATDALQQTAGREVDRALQDFKVKHPETGSIMDFERLVLLDASDEVRRRQSVGEPIDDIKKIALETAKKRVGRHNDLQKSVVEENTKRREDAKKKAMLPDFMAAAGFEEAPDAPANVEEAGELLDKILSSEKQKSALGLR